MKREERKEGDKEQKGRKRKRLYLLCLYLL